MNFRKRALTFQAKPPQKFNFTPFGGPMPPLAKLSSRTLSFILDYFFGFFILLPLYFFWPTFTKAVTGIFRSQFSVDLYHQIFNFDLASTLIFLKQLLTSSSILLLPLLPMMIPEIFWGRSLGKLFFGLKIIPENTEKTYLSLLYRFAVKTGPALPLLLSLLFFPGIFPLLALICYGLLVLNLLSYFFLKKRAFHDWLSHTRVHQAECALSRYMLSLFSRIGIKLKIIFTFSLVTFVLVIVISLLNWNLQKNNLNRLLQDTIKGSISTLEKSLSEYILTDNPLEYQMLLRRFMLDPMPGLNEVKLFDLVGERIASSRSLELSKLTAETKSELLQSQATTIKTEGNTLRFLSPITYTYQNQLKSVAFLEFDYDSPTLYAPIYATVKYIIIIALYVLLGASLIIFIFSFYLTKPISALQKGVKNIAQGDLGFKLEIKNHDELGYLGSQFNEMVLSLREKLEIEKFVSGSTRSAIEGQVRKNQNLRIHKEELTFLFSDIRGFTAMSETMEPETVISLLNNYFETLSGLILDNGGDIDKYVGDEIFAFFQGPGKESRAVKAAIAMQRAVNEINETAANPIAIGIGINTGEAVLGSMGSSARKDYTAIGDAVNIGARLCSAAEKGEIVLSESTQTKVAADFDTKLKGHAKLKGKSQPMPIYLVKF